MELTTRYEVETDTSGTRVLRIVIRERARIPRGESRTPAEEVFDRGEQLRAFAQKLAKRIDSTVPERLVLDLRELKDAPGDQLFFLLAEFYFVVGLHRLEHELVDHDPRRRTQIIDFASKLI